MIDDSAKVYSAQLKRQTIDIGEADPGEGPGGPAPLIFRPNRGPEAEFFFFARNYLAKKNSNTGKSWEKNLAALYTRGFTKKLLFQPLPASKVKWSAPRSHLTLPKIQSNTVR